MADFTGIENNNILIDLTELARTTGWTVNGNEATHSSCNPGNLTLLDYIFIPGNTYRYTYQLSITSGIITTNFGEAQSTSGFIDETVVANDVEMYFYADGNCTISNFSIELDEQILSDDAKNTIAFSEKLNKWTSFYTYAPDSAFSMFTKTYMFSQGDAYVQEAETPNRCNFFGTQYSATIWFSTNEQPTVVKTFQSVDYQANQLMVTSPSGIRTSHGDVSELIPIDFQQMVLDSTSYYAIEGLYKASFMRSYPDLINGQQLIGNYMEMSLVTTSPSEVLNLFSTEIKYSHSFQGVR